MIKLKENDVILFQGDSITDGNRGRHSDLNHVHGHGYQYILASELGADNITVFPGVGHKLYEPQLMVVVDRIEWMYDRL